MTDPNPSRPTSDVVPSFFGVVLMASYLALFTVGNQISSAQYSPLKGPADFAMFVLTYRETSIFLLGIVAACLGAWRRRNWDGHGTVAPPTTPWPRAYVSACIGGLAMAFIVILIPNGLDWMTGSLIDLHRSPGGAGQRNYISLALPASFAAFLSGNDDNFYDKVLATALKKFGLGEAAPAPAQSPQSSPTNPTPAPHVATAGPVPIPAADNHV